MKLSVLVLACLIGAAFTAPADSKLNVLLCKSVMIITLFKFLQFQKEDGRDNLNLSPRDSLVVGADNFSHKVKYNMVKEVNKAKASPRDK